MRRVLMTLIAAVLLIGALDVSRHALAQGAHSASRDDGLRHIGWGWLFTNDAFGDRHDRWRSGGISMSQAFGSGWNGAVPATIGTLWELRFRAEVIQPDNLTRFDPSDRRYAGVVALGLHNHIQRGSQDFAFGGDLVMIGPHTEMDDVQSTLHELVGGSDLDDTVRSSQIQNQLRPTAVFEYGRRLDMGAGVTVRPFTEARLGDETLVRVGADMVIGASGQAELQVRDTVTGHRYHVAAPSGSGLALLLGVDTAYVSDSVYIPSDDPIQLSGRRDRVRAGLSYRQGDLSMFYGMTWLGPEFDSQPQGQIVGSLQLQLRF